ncbi:MAG: hypothetical protein ABII82_18890 [Verrucomicrobiota bacterium]
MTVTVMGIDPGLSGAVARFVADELVVLDMPTVEIKRGGRKKRDIDIRQLYDIIAVPWAVPQHVYLEKAGAMPGQGVSSMFAYGKGYGVILGLLTALGIPYTEVPPATWKRALRVPAGKDGARARASQLMPTAAHQWPLKKHDGRAEAALLACYGRLRVPE